MEDFAKEVPKKYKSQLNNIVSNTNLIDYVDDTWVQKILILYNSTIQEQKDDIRYNKSIFLFELGKYLMKGNEAHKKRAKNEILLAYIEDLISYKTVEEAKSKEPYKYIINNDLFKEDILNNINKIVIERKNTDYIPDRPRRIYYEQFSKPNIKNNYGNKIVTMKENIDALEEKYNIEKKKHDPYVESVSKFEQVKNISAYSFLIWAFVLIIKNFFKIHNNFLEVIFSSIYALILFIIIYSSLLLSQRQIKIIRKKCNYEDIDMLYIKLWETYKAIEEYENIKTESNKEKIIKKINEVSKIISKWDVGNIKTIINKYEKKINVISHDFKNKAKTLIKNNEYNRDLKNLILNFLVYLYEEDINSLDDVVETLNKISYKNMGIFSSYNANNILSNYIARIILSICIGYIPILFVAYLVIPQVAEISFIQFMHDKPTLIFEYLSASAIISLQLYNRISKKYEGNN